MRIPIKNIYYLLCYAWNKLEEKDRIKVSIDDTTELPDLFARVLIHATQRLLKQGIDQSYEQHTEEVYGLKGKLQTAETIKRHLLHRRRTICTFDELSVNILHNQILVTTIHHLSRTDNLTTVHKKELIRLKRMLPDIQLIHLHAGIFKQVQLNRHNRFYKFVMNICEFIHNSLLPGEEEGTYFFSDFTRDERAMNQVFETFIRNFYRIEQQIYPRVRKETIHWQLAPVHQDMEPFIPRMETDITLENDQHKIIIDAKFYKETLTSYYDKETIRSSHLYQLISYLVNQRDHTLLSQTAKGILLYPTIDTEYDLEYTFQTHPIHIRTVNLNTDWQSIHKRLMHIIQYPLT